MNIFEFKEKIKPLPYFETKELRLILGEEFTPTTLVNLKNWVKKGYLIMLRRGLYTMSELKDTADVMAFATKLYAPSYVSLETALSHYGIIPEAVFTTTSVTTRKTKTFSTPLGTYSYQKIKREAFGGFEAIMRDGVSFNLASPEKAVADFLYLNRNVLDGSHEQFEGYRFDEDFDFDATKLRGFAEAFGNAKTAMLTDRFIQRYASK